MERLDERIKARKKNLQERRQEREEEEKEKAEEAEREKAREIERIKELRIRKTELEKTLAEGQKLIYKQAYSRPLYKYNAHLNGMTDTTGDYSFLQKGVKAEMKKQIVSKLLEKVTALEGKVQEDVHTHLYSARGGQGEDISDNVSQYTGGLGRMTSVSSAGGLYGGLRKRLRKLQSKAPK